VTSPSQPRDPGVLTVEYMRDLFRFWLQLYSDVSFLRLSGPHRLPFLRTVTVRRAILVRLKVGSVGCENEE
jgi:hypothetical protein